jgi:hypothetical protein
MEHLVDYVHSKGLKFGLYSDAVNDNIINILGLLNMLRKTWLSWV